MSDFEDKLNQILSSPEDLEKIMNLARSFSGSDSGGQQGDSGSSPASALGGLDPKLIGLMGRIMGEYSSTGSEKTVLLESMRPYLKESRQASITRAIEVTKIAKLAKLAFSEFGGDFHL